MTQPQLLAVEIRTIQNPDIDFETLPTITIYHDSQDNYFPSTEIKEIENAVLGMVPHLDTSCRYLLLFSVRLLPGTETDAILTSIASSRPRCRTRRKFKNH
ncbi:hypothetical protein [Myxosarcina sp. GI1]|uniref:hypothetical protein n=1 Tax=Myxosarcina sp. GI1 TaxID=1541065 RepID=UPI0012E04119|nr:hypothetical protein [Myxosarcina sp. GI1]